jgi:transcriptional regulator with XRE-family HTH domain
VPATPKRAGRTAKPGSRFLSEVLADNVHAIRSLQRLSQEDLADRMQKFGEDWSRATVGQIERYDRTVNVDELGHLALALGVTIGQLLDPTGPGHHREEKLDVGLPDVLPPWWAHTWLRDRLVVATFHGDMSELRMRPAPELEPRAQKVFNQVARHGEARPFDPAWVRWAETQEHKKEEG